jgi:hypothetical protein
MIRISRNNLSPELKAELSRLSRIGDLIGGASTFADLPTENDALTGAGLSIIDEVIQIKSHDIIVVADALADGHGRNAIYEASTTTTAGDAVTWAYVTNMEFPIPKRTLVLSTNVPAVIGGTVDVIADDVYAIWNSDHKAVEVFVNGLYETGFIIDENTKKLSLTGYPTDGWTAEDIVEVFVWKVA